MLHTPSLLLMLSLAAFTTSIAVAENKVLADTGDNKDQQPLPPPLPEENRDSLPEPEVNIIHREDRTIEEYRVNGTLRYIKVIPQKGPPYYFVDTNGDGILDQQFSSLDNPPLNQWILFRW
jgi:hypothetical protein